VLWLSTRRRPGAAATRSNVSRVNPDYSNRVE
jgi:hypothetical protein